MRTQGTDDESTVRVVRGQSGVEISNGWQPHSGLNPKISSFSLAAVGAVLIANTMAELAAGFLSRKARESAPNTPTTILSLKDLAANTITGCAAESDPASVAAAVSEWEDEALQLLKHKLSWTVLAHLRGLCPGQPKPEFVQTQMLAMRRL